MPISIKNIGIGTDQKAYKKGNIAIGDRFFGYGPTNITGYWNGIDPPVGGHTIYLMENVSTTISPSIYVVNNDSELISLINLISRENYTTIPQVLSYVNSNSNIYVQTSIYQNLRIHVDPGNINSYPQTGTSFKDLITDVNGTLYNGVSFTNTDGNGAFSFDGIDDYGVISESTPSWLLGNPSFTVCGYFKKNGDWSSGGVWGIGGSSGGINSWNGNNTNQITIDYWGSPTYTTGQQYSLTEWKFCAWRKIAGIFNKTNISIFVNDFEYTGNNLVDVRGGTKAVNIGAGGVNLAIAGRYESFYPSKSVIGLFSVYDTALSNDDILKYYNTTKPRFGL